MRSAEDARIECKSTSLPAAILWSTAWPSRFLRSMTTLRLLRLLARKSAPIRSERRGPIERVISPSGGSTLMTSAPMSPRYCAVIGPSTTDVRSRTLTPSSGPCAVIGSSLVSLSRYAACIMAIHSAGWMENDFTAQIALHNSRGCRAACRAGCARPGRVARASGANHRPLLGRRRLGRSDAHVGRAATRQAGPDLRRREPHRRRRQHWHGRRRKGRTGRLHHRLGDHRHSLDQPVPLRTHALRPGAGPGVCLDDLGELQRGRRPGRAQFCEDVAGISRMGKGTAARCDVQFGRHWHDTSPIRRASSACGRTSRRHMCRFVARRSRFRDFFRAT